jgi:hypothetical protein
MATDGVHTDRPQQYELAGAPTDGITALHIQVFHFYAFHPLTTSSRTIDTY